MKSQDIFANDMSCPRPESLKFGWLIQEPDSTYIVQQCIEPDIGYVIIIKWNWDSPVETASRDTQIIETARDKTHYFFITRLGHDKSRVLSVIIEQPIAVVRQAK